jgi:hypothetical protein
MKVRLSAEVVSDDDALLHLYDILRFFESGRHQWIVDDVDAIERSQWVEKAGALQGGRILELLRKAVTDAAYGEAMSSVEIEIGAGDGRIPPAVACNAMGKPAYLVVENATSDGRFLRALIHAYDNPRLRTALAEQWLEIDQAGGVGEIAKRVYALIHERSSDRRRIQALVDSDRLRADHDSPTMKTMRALQEEHGVFVHILHKRDSENYLPLDAIAHFKHESKRFRKTYNAFCQLSSQQQDHFDMKKGFARDGSGTAQIDPEQVDLFGGLRRAVLDDLVGGFGPSCGCWFEDREDEIPYYITRSALEARCSTKPGELPVILAKVEAML